MTHCLVCQGYCVATYNDKFYPKGERMARSLMAGNYDVVMKRLYENPHLFLYDAGLHHRNIFRYAIFRTIEKGEDYSFLQLLLDFGRANLSPEEYSDWLNSYNCLGIGVGTYYKYPIYKSDLKMVHFLLEHGIPFPSNILLCCVSNQLGAKFRLKNPDNSNTMIKMMFEFLSRGADPSGCEAHKPYSWTYLSFTFPLMFVDQIYKNEFKQILEFLYIYGIDFDRGNKHADRSNFSTEEEYIRYKIMGVIDDDKELPLFWLSNQFYEIIREIMECGCSCSIIRSNILQIFILYFSDKYNVDFSPQSQLQSQCKLQSRCKLQLRCKSVTQYFDHFLTDGIHKLIIDSISHIRNQDYIRQLLADHSEDESYWDQMSILKSINDKMNCFILSTDQKISFLLYLMGDKIHKIFEYSFVMEIIISYI
jgi:hypothetical protein